MKRLLFSALLPLFILFYASGCGFHLRGSNLAQQSLFKFQTLYIDSPILLPTGHFLSREMKLSNKLVDSPKEAQVVIKLYGENTKKTVLSIDSTGRIREYTLSYQLDYQVIQPNQAAATIHLSREFSYDDTKVLAKEAEEQILITRMQEDAAAQIVRVLSNLSLAKAPPTNHPESAINIKNTEVLGKGDTGPAK